MFYILLESSISSQHLFVGWLLNFFTIFSLLFCFFLSLSRLKGLISTLKISCYFLFWLKWFSNTDRNFLVSFLFHKRNLCRYYKLVEHCFQQTVPNIYSLIPCRCNRRILLQSNRDRSVSADCYLRVGAPLRSHLRFIPAWFLSALGTAPKPSL